MLRLDPRYVRELRTAKGATGLFPSLQRAIELEHSTIPPYLTAWYSLKPGLNDQVGALLRYVVIEEMLHMTIAANILVSLGGSPAINKPEFVPTYPGPLPMGIGGSDFTVHLAPFSMDLVLNTFMVIEEPEEPVPVSFSASQDDAEEPTYRTIGEFYSALKDKLRALPAGSFGHVDRQVVGMWPETLSFPIVDAESACAAIDIIIEQGEGTSKDPFEDRDGDGKPTPAHYYRFGQIYYGAELIKKRSPKLNTDYAYGGAPIPFVASGVYPMRPDPSALQFAEGTYGRLLTDNFTQGYSSLLNSLHAAFNGEPERIKETMGLMYQLRFLAQKLMSTPLQEGMVATAGPVFRYVKG